MGTRRGAKQPGPGQLLSTAIFIVSTWATKTEHAQCDTLWGEEQGRGDSLQRTREIDSLNSEPSQ